MQLDHVVILVRDLDSATQEWSSRGFTITPGGVHSDGQTHNALICFRDGSYLELLAFRVSAPKHRWARYLGAWGLIDVCLAVDDMDAALASLSQRGLNYLGPVEGGRERHDGVVLRWRGAFPPEDSGLPFLIQDLTPRVLRVPQGANTVHQNAAVGIAQVRIGVPSLETAQPAFDALLGRPEATPQARTYRLKGCSVHLHQPELGSVEARFIAQRGSGPVAVTLAAPVPIVIRPEGLS
ncbi:MAG: VOC family protein [Thermoflexales bacterium]|nr:VOC family protein [Thermoflexales bacterium]